MVNFLFSRNILFWTLRCKCPVVCFNAKDFVRTVLQLYGEDGSWKHGKSPFSLSLRLRKVVRPPCHLLQGFLVTQTLLLHLLLWYLGYYYICTSLYSFSVKNDLKHSHNGLCYCHQWPETTQELQHRMHQTRQGM